MTSFDRYFPWIAVGMTTVVFVVFMIPPGSSDEGMDLQRFGKLPVQYQGRIMPLDSLARNSLLIISHRQTYKDEKDKTRPAIQWLLEVFASRVSNDVTPMIPVDETTVRLLALSPRPQSNRYSYMELLQARRKFIQRFYAGHGQDPKKNLPMPTQIKELEELLRIYSHLPTRFSTDHKVFRIDNHDVQDLLGLKRREGSRYALSEFLPAIPELGKQVAQAEKIPAKERDTFQTQVIAVANKVQRYLALGDFTSRLAMVPPLSSPNRAEWLEMDQVLGFMPQTSSEYKAADAINTMVQSYAFARAADADSGAGGFRKEVVDSFNESLVEYDNVASPSSVVPTSRVRMEHYFNHVQPFFACMIFYVLIFLLAVCSWIGWSGPLQRAAFWMLVVTFTVHSLALIARMYIMGRPPVTNLYSSAVFIGWGCVLIGVVMERLHPYGVSTAVGALIGFGTMIIAHHLAQSGDTMEVMEAVLDTNFWLSTHVTLVTFGYVATAFAGGIGAFYILSGVFVPSIDPKFGTILTRMTYGILCFATLLSFVGTVLGGIWADQSWGRFWGWDPKENGAVLIVIWNALILHARWSGMVKQRGIAVLSVFGMMVVGWSWFGTNQLGIGLHAYGFNNTLAVGLTVVWGFLLVVIGVGLLPRHLWKSFGPASMAMRETPAIDTK